jgi:hypothetical protein
MDILIKILNWQHQKSCTYSLFEETLSNSYYMAPSVRQLVNSQLEMIYNYIAQAF